MEGSLRIFIQNEQPGSGTGFLIKGTVVFQVTVLICGTDREAAIFIGFIFGFVQRHLSNYDLTLTGNIQRLITVVASIGQGFQICDQIRMLRILLGSIVITLDPDHHCGVCRERNAIRLQIFKITIESGILCNGIDGCLGDRGRRC